MEGLQALKLPEMSSPFLCALCSLWQKQLSPELSHQGQLLCPAYRHGSSNHRSDPGTQQLPGPDFLHEEAEIWQAEDVSQGHL